MDSSKLGDQSSSDDLTDVLSTDDEQLDAACDAFEAAWQRGESPRIEDFLNHPPNVSPDQLLAELFSIEQFWRRRRGESPSFPEYERRFPDHAETLKRLIAESQETIVLRRTEERGQTQSPGGEQPAGKPSQLGNYDLLETIGQGGMGTVYRARQRSADRVVALKVVRSDLLESLPAARRDSVVERFHHEVQAAARIDDQHIVRIYEVGDDDGQHFFSMRYVEGKSLSEILRDGPLPPRRAARYLQPVARALHKAHQNGILHRDLKPQNILVETDSDTAMVADFGLAKLGTDNQELTRTGEVLGTPPYMSPEQAQDSGRVSVSSDVYSLGATLYHLLTGRPPFQAATAVDTLRQVLDDDPVGPRRMNGAVDRDLDTICMKCLQKEPARRYGSAEALAEDLERYLAGEPIQARPIGYGGRIWRWCRRNPIEATLTAAAVSFLVLAIVFLVVGQANTRAALKEAEENRQRAEESFAHAREAVDNFYTSVSEHTLLKQDGMQPLRAELLQKALEYDQKFLAQRSGDPSQQRRVAASHFRVAQITELIGSLDQSMNSYRQALDLYQQLAEQHPGDYEITEKLGNTYSAMGRVAHRLGKYKEAKEFHLEAERLRRKLAESRPSNKEFHRCLANTHMNLGLLEKDTGDVQAAEKFLTGAQDIRRDLIAEHPRFNKLRRDYGMGYFNLASLHLTGGDVATAGKHLIDATAEFEILADVDPDDLENQWRLAICYRLRGDLRLRQQNTTEALELYARAGALIERLSHANPEVAKYRVELIGLQINVGQLYASQNETAQAIQSLGSARDLIEPLIQEHPEVPRYRRDFATAYLALVQQQTVAKDYAAALENAKLAQARFDKLLGALPGDKELQRRAMKINKLARQLAERLAR